MATQRFLAFVGNKISEVVATVVSAGAANAGQLVATDNNGKVDISVLPAGVGADTATMTASEAITAGAFVNVWSNAGVGSVRNADASAGANGGKPADGFVLVAAAASASVLVYFGGVNSAVTGQVPGPVFLSPTTPGGAVATGATAAGQTFQQLGTALSATAIQFENEQYYLRA